MKAATFQQDLVVLTPDKDIQLTMEGLLSRPKDLGIRPVTKVLISHHHRDPGVLRDAPELLRAYLRVAHYALVVLDRVGCGKERLSRAEIETEIEQNLSKNGWPNRCAAVAIDPELEIWVWNRDYRVASILGWRGDYASLKRWMIQKKLLPAGRGKPDRPKEALQAVLRETRTPRSASLYKELARAVKLDTCTDAAFHKLRSVLREWFGPGP